MDKIGSASSSNDGFMSASDKGNIDGILAGTVVPPVAGYANSAGAADSATTATHYLSRWEQDGLLYAPKESDSVQRIRDDGGRTVAVGYADNAGYAGSAGSANYANSSGASSYVSAFDVDWSGTFHFGPGSTAAWYISEKLRGSIHANYVHQRAAGFALRNEFYPIIGVSKDEYNTVDIYMNYNQTIVCPASSSTQVCTWMVIKIES
jgi:hypothetical protein